VANARAGEGLDRPGSHATDADDGDPGDEKAIQGGLAIKPGNAAEAVKKRIEVSHRGGLMVS
jgi:hypothetical protein